MFNINCCIIFVVFIILLITIKTEMTTRPELAFKALDIDNSGYITGNGSWKLNSYVYRNLSITWKENLSILRMLNVS